MCPLCLASPGRAAAGPLPSNSSFLLPFDDPEPPPIYLSGLGGMGEGVCPQRLYKSEAAGGRKRLHRAHHLERLPRTFTGTGETKHSAQKQHATEDGVRPTGGTLTTAGSPPAPQGVCPTMLAPAPDSRGEIPYHIQGSFTDTG